MPMPMAMTTEQRAVRQTFPTMRDRLNVLRCDIKEVLHDAGHEGYTYRQLGRYFRYTFGADLRWALRSLVSKGVVVKTKSVYRLRTRVKTNKEPVGCRWCLGVTNATRSGKSLVWFGLFVATFVAVWAMVLWWQFSYASFQQQQAMMTMASGVVGNCYQKTADASDVEHHDDDAIIGSSSSVPISSACHQNAAAAATNATITET